MRVLIADRFSEAARADLAEIGFDVCYEPDASGDALADAISRTKAEVLVVRSTRVTADMLEAGRLRLVIRAGAGFNTIDVETAKSLDINVSNCPGKNSNAVAEIAFGLIIDVGQADNGKCLRPAEWNLAQSVIQQCARACRQHARSCRRRQDWACHDSESKGIWNVGRRLESFTH